MAKNKIFCFPHLNRKQKEKFTKNNTIDITFSYEKNNEMRPLDLKPIDGLSDDCYQIDDTNNDWYVEEDVFYLSGSVNIRDNSFLFGPNGVAVHDAQIGIAIMFSSGDSRHRGVVKIGDFKANETVDLPYMHKFQKGEFRGKVVFEVILYISKPGDPRSDENFLANVEGFRVGVLKTFNVVMDGEGSWFPVYEKYMPDEPLWRLECDLRDPEYSMFSDNVELQINKAHKNYKYLDITSNTFNQQLMAEVISQSISTMIFKLKLQEYDWDNTMNATDYLDGSVSQVIKYFMDTMDCDPSEIDTLAYSVRKNIESKFKL